MQVDLPPTNYIYLDVGWITRKLSVDNFFTIHSCNSLLSLHALPRLSQFWPW